LTQQSFQHDFNATQVPPEWHSWISHIRLEPPTNDPVVQNLSPPWQAVRINYIMHRLTFEHALLQPWVENLTGTRGAYRPYNTVVPKINAWEAKVKARG
jgi:NADH dehydrogenase (ubiquinone) 1 alpha subcomplex subunit 12